MAKGKKSDITVCPNCGTKDVKPEKTWQLVSPLPDAKGRITITVMGTFQCPNCGKRWRGVVSKIKAGGTSLEISGKEGTKTIGDEVEKDEPYTIELDIDNLGDEDEEE